MILWSWLTPLALVSVAMAVIGAIFAFLTKDVNKSWVTAVTCLLLTPLFLTWLLACLCVIVKLAIFLWYGMEAL